MLLHLKNCCKKNINKKKTKRSKEFRFGNVFFVKARAAVELLWCFAGPWFRTQGGLQLRSDAPRTDGWWNYIYICIIHIYIYAISKSELIKIVDLNITIYTLAPNVRIFFRCSWDMQFGPIVQMLLMAPSLILIQSYPWQYLIASLTYLDNYIDRQTNIQIGKLISNIGKPRWCRFITSFMVFN